MSQAAAIRAFRFVGAAVVGRLIAPGGAPNVRCVTSRTPPGRAHYRIRRARLADLDALMAIETAAFDAARYAGSTMSRKSFAGHIAVGRNPLFVSIESAGKTPACGYSLGFVRQDSPYVRFYSLAILPEHAGKGAGRLLFEAIENFARRNRYRGVRLEIRADNRRLLDRYMGIGYRVFAEIPKYYVDGCAAIRMVRDL